MTEKEQLEDIKNRIEITFTAFQMLNDKAGELITSLSERVSKLEHKIYGLQTLSRNEVLTMADISGRTFSRKLKSGDIKEVDKGRYAVSGGLYRKIYLYTYKLTGESSGSLKAFKKLKPSDYPAYVFKTP